MKYFPPSKGYWPDYEVKLDGAWKEVSRSLLSLAPAINMCKQKRVAIQAGGHMGYFAIRLAQNFRWVHSFEPDPESYECLERNTAGVKNMTAYPFGLGMREESLKLMRKKASGTSCIDPEGTIHAAIKSLDSFNISDVDLMVIDVEAYEVEVFSGAVETIDKFSPIIQVELLPRARDRIDGWLRNMGYKFVRMTGYRDGIYSR